MIIKNGYLARTSGSGSRKGTNNKDYRDWWLIKRSRLLLNPIIVPEEYMGKRIRFKVEDIDESTFWRWFDENLIYSGDTKSFVCRLFPEQDRNELRDRAFKVIKEMKQEFEQKQNQGEHKNG